MQALSTGLQRSAREASKSNLTLRSLIDVTVTPIGSSNRVAIQIQDEYSYFRSPGQWYVP